MSKKNIKTYTPGKDDFLKFAETMNKNAAMDMKNINQSASNQIVAPTQPTLNSSTEVTNVSEPEQTPTVPVEYPEAQAHGQGTQASDQGTQTQEESVSNYSNGDLLSEEEWYASRGLDPDADYQNAVNSLTYDYETSLANYGENAEKLYQMGLSGSGVSDVFQANAYSAYIKAMNDARLNQINAKKNNKLLYGQYKDQYNANVDKSVTDAFNAYASTYTPEREGTIRQTLQAQGMSESAINTAIQKMKSYQDTLPEGEKAINQAVNEIYTQYANEYHPSMHETYKAILESSGKYSDAEIEAALDKLDDLNSSMLTVETEKYLGEDLKLRDASLETAYNILSETTEEKVRKKIQEQSENMVQKALESVQNLQEAYNLVGYDQATWDSMSDGDKILKILETAGKYAKKGVISEEEYEKTLETWVHNEFSLEINTSKTWELSAAMGTLGANVRAQVDTWYKNDILTKNVYDKLIRYIEWKQDEALQKAQGGAKQSQDKPILAQISAGIREFGGDLYDTFNFK